MAEGGIAAAMGNVDPRQLEGALPRHHARRQVLNNWRMAELHAQEAPDRVRELEDWGALFDRTKDGRSSSATSAATATPRLAHVGDRTGLEMIRTLQDHGVHSGIDVHMECTVTELLKTAATDRRRVRLLARDRRFIVFEAPGVVLATGGIGKRLQDHVATRGSTPATATRWRTTPAPS
jgi:succinate dehydrogenase / fumarate reductase flavoprotein subunit